MNSAAYSAAARFPAKLKWNRAVLDERGKIKPYHLQINPTNECNLNCPFCSCANRARGDSMPFEEAASMLAAFQALGTRAVTVTGGGEPLLYPHINGLLEFMGARGMSAGLVTNGTVMDRLESGKLTWCRISLSDGRPFDEAFAGPIVDAIGRFPRIDWAFSYVLTRTPNWGNLKYALAFAVDHGFTHVRVVSDLLNLDAVPEAEEVRRQLDGTPGESLTFYQGRKEYVRGRRRCLISLLKPVVSADGGIYPCCGVQYALEHPSRDYEKSMRMCHWSEFGEHILAGAPFDGSGCFRCYYDDYNEALAEMLKPLPHQEFV